jgi:hypothetical protein
MLVKKIGETVDATLSDGDVDKGLIVQRKFNGTRSPSHLVDGVPDMYSRTNRDHLGLNQIRKELVASMTNAPKVPPEYIGDGADIEKLYDPKNLFLDGELYLHGKSLRWISGQARKEDDDGTLNYVIYDCFFPAAIAAGHQLTSKQRQSYLDMFFDNSPELTHIRRVENFKISDLKEINAFRDQFLVEGYEGAIVRKDWTGYQYGINNYHSSNLIKVKPMYDSEFKVVGYTQGTKGKDVGALIWVCEVEPTEVKKPGDITFSVVPKNMTYVERYNLFSILTPEKFDKFIKNKLLTVEFPERSSKTGKPTQAKALQFRAVDDEEDPLSALKSSVIIE